MTRQTNDPSAFPSTFELLDALPPGEGKPWQDANDEPSPAVLDTGREPLSAAPQGHATVLPPPDRGAARPELAAYGGALHSMQRVREHPRATESPSWPEEEATPTVRTSTMAPVSMSTTLSDDGGPGSEPWAVRRPSPAYGVVAAMVLMAGLGVVVYTGLQPSARSARIVDPQIGEAAAAAAIRMGVTLGPDEPDPHDSFAGAQDAASGTDDGVLAEFVTPATPGAELHIVAPITIMAPKPEAASQGALTAREPEGNATHYRGTGDSAQPGAQAPARYGQAQAVRQPMAPWGASILGSGTEAAPGSMDVQWQEPARPSPEPTEAQLRPNRLRPNRAAAGQRLLQSYRPR